jgi:hypothetical protein
VQYIRPTMTNMQGIRESVMTFGRFIGAKWASRQHLEVSRRHPDEQALAQHVNR